MTKASRWSKAVLGGNCAAMLRRVSNRLPRGRLYDLAGHLECFHRMGGVARTLPFDNLKSVVLKREPVIEYNPNFLDFSRHYGFSIHACNPSKGNEKGRVERLIRDCRVFLYGETFQDLKELNQKFQAWLTQRNGRVYRVTQKAPKALLAEERLVKLPVNPYPPRRMIPGVRISKTALVEFDSNRYSVPTAYGGRHAEIMAYPGHLEVWVSGKKVATHRRTFKRRQLIENPLHAEKLLQRSPRFKHERILRLMKAMDPALQSFLNHQDSGQVELEAAYELFRVMKLHSKALVTSACRELLQMGTFRIKALRSLLELPTPKESGPLWPQNPNLLHIQYEPRSLMTMTPIDELWAKLKFASPLPKLTEGEAKLTGPMLEEEYQTRRARQIRYLLARSRMKLQKRFEDFD